MNQNFNTQAYRAGFEVYCDNCGKTIEMNGATFSRIIAKDEEGYNVAEQYFDCPHCGTHYTVAVIDRKMQRMIQQRQQIRKQIELHRKIKSREKTFLKLQKEDERIKQLQEAHMKILKAKYEKECRQ